MSALVVTETAKVFRSGGRRFFTKKSAYRRLAKQRLRNLCEYEKEDWHDGYPGYTCYWHKLEADKLEKILSRLTYIYIRHDQKLLEGQP